jgi:hypothetical protein
MRQFPVCSSGLFLEINMISKLDEYIVRKINKARGKI